MSSIMNIVIIVIVNVICQGIIESYIFSENYPFLLLLFLISEASILVIVVVLISVA